MSPFHIAMHKFHIIISTIAAVIVYTDLLRDRTANPDNPLMAKLWWKFLIPWDI